MCLDIMLLYTYPPLKRINKYKLKFKSKSLITLGLIKKNFTLTTKYIEIYSPPLQRKVNRLIMLNILKLIWIILRTHGKE